MKNFLFAGLLVFSVAFGATAQATTETVKIKTSAICGMCKATIERQLAFTKGVNNAELDVATKVATIVYNPRKTNVVALQKAINDSGYDADALPATPKAYDRLAPCCKKDVAPHRD